MDRGRRIRVLVVDDSAFFRQLLSQGLASDPELEIVAVARDAFDAREKIDRYDPDVMTCDIEMPKMDGIEFIKRLMPEQPLPVIVVSGINDAVFEALKAGAVDFVAKPAAGSDQAVDVFIADMITKVKIAAQANVLPGRKSATVKKAKKKGIDIIAIGASTGGTEAIHSVLTELPPTVPGIVIVQHIPAVFSRMFAERLDRSTRFQVSEAKSGAEIKKGQVLVAPGGQHLTIKKVGSGYGYQAECFQGAKVNGHCPSVDVLFESVAAEAGERAVGIILTGMGSDGAKGMLSLRKKGARTIGQDEESAVIYGMPKAAFNLDAVEVQASLPEIPRLVSSLLDIK